MVGEKIYHSIQCVQQAMRNKYSEYRDGIKVNHKKHRGQDRDGLCAMCHCCTLSGF